MILPPFTTINTQNWVGYSWSSSTKASGQWTAPSFPWKTQLSASEKQNKNGLALWVGLGVNPIEQVGFYSHYSNGRMGWYGLYQFWPNPPQSFGAAISPGDTMLASVNRSGFNYTLRLQDTGPHHRWTVSITKAFHHVENQAEFIAEDYTYTGAYYPLTGFSPVTAKVSGVPHNRYAAPWGYATANDHTVTVHG